MLAFAGALALAAGLTSVPVAAAAPALADPGMPEEVLAEYRQQFPDVPVDVLYQRLSLTAGRKRLLEKFGTEHAATFGGSFYDYRAGVWHLFATDAAAADTMAARARAIGVTPQTRVVRYSVARLHARAERIRAGQDPMSKVSRQAGVDVFTNSVTVAAAKATSQDAMVRYVAPQSEDAGPDDACTDRRNCGAPLRTGIILWRRLSTGEEKPLCSLGYAAKATDGSMWALTAGHCVEAINETWGHGGQYLGAVRQCGKPYDPPASSAPCLQTGEVDVARVRISNPYWFTYGFGYIFYNPSTYVNVNYSILSRYTIEVGDGVCISGWHNNYTGFPSGDPYDRDEVSVDTCGLISSQSDPTRYGMPTVGGASACGGDSGGAWLFYPGNSQRWAYGVHRNGDKDLGDICGNGTKSWFSAVPSVNAFFDANSAAEIRIVTRP